MPDISDTTQLNHDAFMAKLPEMLKTHAGKHALFKDGKLIDYWVAYEAAIKDGYKRFGLGPFYVGRVATPHVDSIRYLQVA